MSTLNIVLASTSGLVLGYAAAAHFGSRARALLESSLKKDQERVLKASKKEIKELTATVEELKENEDSAELNEKIAKLEKRVKELQSSRDKEANLNKEALDKIKGELEAAQARASATGISAELRASIDAAGGGLDDILKALITHESQKAALLADANGIKIASAGDPDSVDGISAATGTLTGIPKQLDNVLPLGDTFAYRLTDGKHAIAGLSFVSEGELMALTTIGEKAASEAAIAGALDSLRAALE